MAFPNNPCTINLVHDNSTFANFCDAPTAIDACLLAFGWKQSIDTGQVNWLGMSISNCVYSGGVNTFTYSGLTTSGHVTAPLAGMAINISGYTGGATGNNGTFLIASASAVVGGAGTFTVANASGVTSASAVSITKQTTVPSSTYVYSIWVSQDAASGTQPIYVKMWYGYSTTVVRIQVTPGSGSNGTGTISNAGTSTPWQITYLDTNEGATAYASYFSGDSGSFRMYLWQSGSVTSGTLLVICRSVDSSGAWTADYWSYWAANSAYAGQAVYQAFSLSLGNGPQIDTAGAWPCGLAKLSTGNYGIKTASFPIFPLVPPTAVFGNALLDLISIIAGDSGDGASIDRKSTRL